jgi:hypothetical protein
LRVTSHILLAILTPMSVAVAQLSGGFGPVGQLSSAESAWRTSASLWGTARYEGSLTSSEISGQLTSGTGALRVGTVGGRQQIFSPSLGGLRATATFELGSRRTLDIRDSSGLSATSSLSYRRGFAGAWVGLKTERNTTAALRVGGWRQLGSWLTVAISSSLRRGTYGERGARTWTGTYRDSIPTDTGWVFIDRPGTFGDSGSPGRKLSWFETEANVGWTRGRFALDGALGWRPPIDSTPRATWFRAVTTIAVTKDVALSAGAGTTMRQIPYARATGRLCDGRGTTRSRGAGPTPRDARDHTDRRRVPSGAEGRSVRSACQVAARARRRAFRRLQRMATRSARPGNRRNVGRIAPDSARCIPDEHSD